MNSLLKKFYDPELNYVDTSQGRITMGSIFFPMFLEMFLNSVLATFNTWILSFYSDEAVAAVGTAGQVLSMLLTLFSVVSTGASIYMGQKIGARDDDSASEAAFTGTVFMLLVSLILCTCLAGFSGPVMRWMNLSGEALTIAISYFRIVIQFAFLNAFITMLGAVFRSYGRPRLSVYVNLIAGGINVLLNVLVILHPFASFPLSGATGIAWARVIAYSIGSVLIFVVFLRVPLGIRFHGDLSRSVRTLGRVLQIGIPSGISSLSYSGSQVITTAIIAALGVATVSTKVYVSSIVYYVYVTGLSLGMATSLMISWLCGAGNYDKAYRLNIQALRFTIVLNAGLSALLFLAGTPILRLFTSDPDILRQGKIILGIDILVEIFRGFNHIEENSLRGSGDVLFPMCAATFSCWTMSVLGGYLLGVVCGFGLPGIWLAFGLDEMCRALLYLARWRSGRWKNATVARR